MFDSKFKLLHSIVTIDGKNYPMNMQEYAIDSKIHNNESIQDDEIINFELEVDEAEMNNQLSRETTYETLTTTYNTQVVVETGVEVSHVTNLPLIVKLDDMLNRWATDSRVTKLHRRQILN